MDLKRIFIKDACPTKMGGQAVIDGIMMKGATRTSVAVRQPDDSLYIKIQKNKTPPRLAKIPLLRGVVIFLESLIQGTATLTNSADIQERWDRTHRQWYQEQGQEAPEEQQESGFYGWLEKKLGEKGARNLALAMSVVFALVFTVLIFVVAPTIVINLFKKVTENHIVLNLLEGCLRIILFAMYILLISRMEEIKDVFRYHGAEHKTIHCFESGLPLTPENAQTFYRMHPRCGTSFLMFVLVISLILFSFLGWPGLLWRILSRILLLPVVAGLSYELLRWAGRSDNGVVRAVSLPGIALQKLTTAEPTEKHLEVAIAAVKAVLNEEGPVGEGYCDLEGRILRPMEDQLEEE